MNMDSRTSSDDSSCRESPPTSMSFQTSSLQSDDRSCEIFKTSTLHSDGRSSEFRSSEEGSLFCSTLDQAPMYRQLRDVTSELPTVPHRTHKLKTILRSKRLK